MSWLEGEGVDVHVVHPEDYEKTTTISNGGNGGKDEEMKMRIFMFINEGNEEKEEEEEDPSPPSMPYHRPIDGRSDDVHVFEHVGDG